MRTCFLLCGTAIAGLALLTTTGAMAQTAVAPSPAPQIASAWAKSVKITAVAVPETDESELLGLSMWRFDIVAAKPAREIKLILEAQEKGKSSHSLAEVIIVPQFGWPLTDCLSIFVGQYPIYDNIGVSTKAKYQVRVSGFRYAPLRERGSRSASGVYDDPLNGLITSSFGIPSQQPDGSFVLNCGIKTDKPLGSPADTAIVFRVEEESN